MPARRTKTSTERKFSAVLYAAGGFVLSLAFAVILKAEAAGAALEYQVKAAFLLNFTKFIDWPESAFASPAAPFAICIVGDDPFGPTLDKIAEGESVGDRKLVVQRLRRPQSGGCQIVFVGKSSRNTSEVLSAAGPGALTVGEPENFLREGGIVRFVIENRRVRFDVNQEAARKAQLTISSKLLNIARKVDKSSD